MITIIDYGMGNLRSVQKAFERLKANAIISSNIGDIKKADKLVLPGVGDFKNGMNKLRELNLIDILNVKVLKNKIPILGICLGMQLFTNRSEEGDVDGLGWIDAETIQFDFQKSENKVKIPHMGWNNINISKKHSVFDNIKENVSFYFVHSYYVKCENKDDILCTTNYGIQFVSGFQKENIIGLQFHPEKSHKSGLEILSNFIGL